MGFRYRSVVPESGGHMSILTSRELEFLASLNTSWARLYCNELARLLREHDVRCDGRHEPPSIIRISAAPTPRPDLSLAGYRNLAWRLESSRFRPLLWSIWPGHYGPRVMAGTAVFPHFV